MDDALAIMLAVTSGQFDILGITTVSGNVSLDQATLNTCKILELLGVSGQIPVFRGADKPLVRDTVFEHRVHGSDGIGGALRGMTVTKRAEAERAEDFIIRQVLAHSGEVTLIMTAPLTNLARAAQMSGAYAACRRSDCDGWCGAGLRQHHADRGIQHVCRSGGGQAGAGCGLPAADAGRAGCNRRALLSAEDIAKLRIPAVREYVEQSTADYRTRYFERNGVQACALHDPLAVGVALNREFVNVQKYYVDVETRSELCDGQTVCDFQNRLNKPANAGVCLEVDAPAFLEYFINSLNSLNQEPKKDGSHENE